MGHASKERVLLIGTDQRITSGPAATTAAFKGRIHGCTRTFREKVRFFSLAPRAPSIHGARPPSWDICIYGEFRRVSELFPDIDSLWPFEIESRRARPLSARALRCGGPQGTDTRQVPI
jgi:hypothetical protein